MMDWRWPDLGGPSALAVDWLRAAVSRADPVAATERALDGHDAASRTWILALGKAANGMALGAVRWLERIGTEPAGGVVISHVGGDPPHARLTAVRGDHPVPGQGSLRGARELERTIASMGPNDGAIVLLSGGASSLTAAPQGSLTQAELAALARALLASGAPIDASNTIRRRAHRWAGGRLAAALSPAAISAFAISDVPGDHVRLIGSGPLTGHQPEDDSFEQSLAVLPAGARRPVERAWRAGQLDLPADQHVAVVLAASNSEALEAAAGAANRAGWQAEARPGALAGEAAATGRSIADEIHALPRGGRRCVIMGGETPVTLGTAGAGKGGRSQELALAAARKLDSEPGVMLLAAGTDGRDGETDAAGALVDGTTWARVPDGDAALRHHDSHTALDAAGALIRTGPTGTNVMDMVIALRW